MHKIVVMALLVILMTFGSQNANAGCIFVGEICSNTIRCNPCGADVYYFPCDSQIVQKVVGCCSCT
jgi:hypothetical protein